MFELHRVDLEKDLIEYITDLINKANKKTVFISANRRPIKFVEQKLGADKVLNVDFFILDEFIHDFVFTYSNNHLKMQTSLERYFFILEILRSNKDIYNKLGGTDQKVFPWAKRVSSLFNEIDKHRLGDRLQNFQYTDLLEQARVIAENLKNLYKIYRNELAKSNLTYTGDLYAKMLDIFDDEKDFQNHKGKLFIFINIIYISNTEAEILKKLSKIGDVYFVIADDLKEKNHHFNPFEAVNNLIKKLSRDANIIDIKEDGNPTSPQINFCAFPDTITEMDHLSNILYNNFKNIKDPKDTAVILPDENALFPLLINLPEDYGDINITMGYPFTSTTFYLFMSNFFEMVIDAKGKKKDENYHISTEKLLTICDYKNIFYEKKIIDDLTAIKNNAYNNRRSITTIAENFPTFHSAIEKFVNIKNVRDLQEAIGNILNWIISYNSTEEKEILFLINTISAFNEHFMDGLKKLPQNLNINLEMGYIIFKELSKDILIPFEGSPLKGLQIMGILESRGLKFKNVFIPDMNEGIIPSADKVDPLLSESIKTSIGLPSYKEKEILMRYNFYRTVYSAENVYIFFKNGISGNQKYTKSRYVEQLLFLEELNNNKPYDKICQPKQNFFIPKNDNEGLSKPKQLYQNNKIYSPTELDDYLTCPYKHYLRHVKQIEPPIRLDSDFKADINGSIIHYLLNEIVKLNEDVTNFKIEDAIDLIENFRNNKNSNRQFAIYIQEMTDLQYEMFKTIIEYRLWQILNKHREVFKENYTVSAKEKMFCNKQLKLKGIIDRIDNVENRTIRIVDYKTGSYIKLPSKKAMDNFHPNQNYSKDDLQFIKDKIRSVQLIVYIMLVKNCPNYKADNYIATYYLIGKNEIKQLSYQDNMDSIVNYLIEHLEQSDKIYPLPGKSCLYCDYNKVCRFADA